MHAIQGILFDKDGTLIDFNRTWLPRYRHATAYLHARFGKRAAAHKLLAYGGFIAESETWQADAPLACGSSQEIIEVWAAAIGEPIAKEVRQDLERILTLPADAYVPVVAEMESLLAELRASGIKLGLATMDSQANAHHMLEATGIEVLFDFVCGADSGFGVKPGVGMVQEFCRICELRSHQVMMVGDSLKDMDMGRNAGVALNVGVLSGVHAAAILAPRADLVLDNIAGLPAVVTPNTL